MNYFFVLVLCLSIFGLSKNQTDGQSGTGASGGDTDTTSGTSGGTNTGKTGTTNGDGTQGYNQGYSYNTGIRPYQTGFTFYQPFGDGANGQNSAGQQSTGAAKVPIAAAPQQPVLQPIGYQPVYAVPQNPGQPIQYHNGPQIVHFGQIPTQGAQPIPVQPIALPNFDGPLLDGFGLGGGPPQPINNNNNRRRQNINNNNRRPPQVAALGADFNPADFGIDLGGGGGGGGGNNNNDNGFFSPPVNNNNNNNNYDNLPDDSSLANFANLGGGQSNDYPDNDFGNIGDFGSATQNRGTFDIPGFNSNSGFFKRK